MTMHDGKDETTMAVPGERVRLLQDRQCAFVLQFGAFQKHAADWFTQTFSFLL
jgi:hypothetical protein